MMGITKGNCNSDDLKNCRTYTRSPWQDWGWECTIEAHMQELSSSGTAKKRKGYARLSNAQLRKRVAMEARSHCRYQLKKARFTEYKYL